MNVIDFLLHLPTPPPEVGAELVIVFYALRIYVRATYQLSLINPPNWTTYQGYNRPCMTKICSFNSIVMRELSDARIPGQFLHRWRSIIRE